MSAYRDEDPRIHDIKTRIRVVPNFPKPGFFCFFFLVVEKHRLGGNTFMISNFRVKFKNRLLQLGFAYEVSSRFKVLFLFKIFTKLFEFFFSFPL